MSLFYILNKATQFEECAIVRDMCFCKYFIKYIIITYISDKFCGFVVLQTKKIIINVSLYIFDVKFIGINSLLD